MRRIAIAVLCMAALFCGCAAQSTIRDRVVVTGLGIHREDGQCALAVQSIELLKTASSLSEQSEAATAVYTARGESVAAALDAFLNEAGRRTYILQNQLLLISTAQCEAQSLFDSLEYLTRNEEGRAQVPVAVCRDNPSELLEFSSGNDAISARYFVGLLEESAATGRSVYRTLLDVQRTSSGMYDAVLPLLSLRGESPQPDGILLFQDGKPAGELRVEQTPFFLLLAGEFGEVLYTENGVTYRIYEAKTRLTVTKPLAFHFDATVRVEAVEQYGGARADTARAGVWLENGMREVLGILDELEVDPLGLVRRAAQHKTVLSQPASCDKTVSVRVIG